MNTFQFYSNPTDDVQDGAVGDYPYISVPQSTHPDFISTPGYPAPAEPYVPNFNATNYAAFTLPPATGMGTYTNPSLTQVDYAYVSSQHV